MLATICDQHELETRDVEFLLDLERQMLGMGRRHGIHQRIRSHIEEIATRGEGDA